MSETVTVSCPSCSKQYRIKAALARQTGKSAKCKACGSAIPLGVEQPAPQAQAKPAAPQAQATPAAPQAQAKTGPSGNTAVQLYRRGVSLAKGGKPKEAIASFDAALQLNPDLAEAHLAKGLCLKKLGDSRKSFASLRKASRLGNAKAKQIISRELGFGDAPVPDMDTPAPAGKENRPQGKQQAADVAGVPQEGEEAPKTSLRRKLVTFGSIKMLLIGLIIAIFLYVIFHVYSIATKNSSLEPAQNNLDELSTVLQNPMDLARYTGLVNSCRESLGIMTPGRKAETLTFVFEHYEAALNLWQALEADNRDALIGGLNRAHQLLPRTITAKEYVAYHDALSLRLHMTDPWLTHLARLQKEEHDIWVEETGMERRLADRAKIVKEMTNGLWVRAALLMKKYHDHEYAKEPPAMPQADIQTITTAMNERKLLDAALAAHLHASLTWLETTIASGLTTPEGTDLSRNSQSTWQERQNVQILYDSLPDTEDLLFLTVTATAQSQEQTLSFSLPRLALIQDENTGQ